MTASFTVALPLFFLEKHDRAAAASSVLNALPADALLAMCAIAAATALALTMWRATALGARPLLAVLAVALGALCAIGHFGIGFSPLAWCFAAGISVLLDLKRQAKWYAPAMVVLVWSVTLGGAALGVLIVTVYACATMLEQRAWNDTARRAALMAATAVLASCVTAAGLSFPFGGGHGLYEYALFNGATRQPLWTSPWSAAALGTFSIVLLATIGGLHRLRPAHAMLFGVFFFLAMIDARMAPFFGLLAAPIAVAANVAARQSATPRVRHILPVALACALVVVTLAIIRPPDPGAVSLLRTLSADGRPHRVACVQTQWCDVVADLYSSKITAVMDDAGNAPSTRARATQKRLSAEKGDLRALFASRRFDALIAYEYTPLASFARALPGWHAVATDAAGRIMIVRGEPQ